MENIEQFNFTVGAIFGELYRNFPRRVRIFRPEIIGIEDESSINDAGMYTAPEAFTRKMEDLWETIRWLHQTG